MVGLKSISSTLTHISHMSRYEESQAFRMIAANTHVNVNSYGGMRQ